MKRPRLDSAIVFALLVWAAASLLVIVAVFGAAGRAVFG